VNEKGGLLEQRFTLHIPDLQYRDCIFATADVTSALAKSDQLDKDTLFLRAAHDTITEFALHKTDTDPPVLYGDLISLDRQRKLMQLVKSQAACPK
jgi:hypothetical protein